MNQFSIQLCLPSGDDLVARKKLELGWYKIYHSFISISEDLERQRYAVSYGMNAIDEEWTDRLNILKGIADVQRNIKDSCKTLEGNWHKGMVELIAEGVYVPEIDPEYQQRVNEGRRKLAELDGEEFLDDDLPF